VAFCETAKCGCKGKKTGELITFLFMKTEFPPPQQKVEKNIFGQEDPCDLYADSIWQ